MNKVTEFDNLTKATRRREFEDGLMDYVFGGTFLFLGLMGSFIFSYYGLRWLMASYIQNQEVTIIVMVTVFLLFILLIYSARRAIEQIRRQTLWKNRGFVKSLRWQVSWQINLLAGLAFLGMIVIVGWLMAKGYVSQEVVLRTIVSSAGVATGIVFYGMGKELDLLRYKWAGTVGGILSMLIILQPYSFSVSWFLLGIIWMVVLAVSGSWALRRSIMQLGDQ
ncbi:hypothetical protein ACFLTX_01545 [Chloroflexota bacterium]